ncbi:RNA-directed DNA polymerase, eukaryota [Tanacetum coccineum]|uniref:RNA-directed DNA polymerase, eukaryota n=1 Tax=Tanacetum coccineum TaxID=301880 RepID=A0ABQ5GU28_9ASTR
MHLLGPLSTLSLEDRMGFLKGVCSLSYDACPCLLPGLFRELDLFFSLEIRDLWFVRDALFLCICVLNLRMRSFPRLYALELKKGITVADKLIDASFVASFRRNPRGGVEEEQLHHLVELVGSISLSPSNDRWAWLLGSSGEFSVHSARTFIDDILLPFVGDVTRWVKVVPIKVNILAWKVCLDKLPTRLNLSLRGIDIPSIICPNCGLAGSHARIFLLL